MNMQNRTLRDIVCENFNAATLLDGYGLDYCCNGGQTLDDACSERGIESQIVLSDLFHLDTDSSSQRYFRWDVSFLIDYILNNHHSFIRDSAPIISTHLKKSVLVHGDNHPEVREVDSIFTICCVGLFDHLLKEEQILFPFIKKLQMLEKTSEALPATTFGMIEQPISVMLHEHETVGGELRQIRELLNDYSVPDDACTTLQLVYKELEAFESDIHKHVFLENTILFPKAIRLEKDLLNKL
jgi:regulator of cell morphogenesis and NO signaling